MAIGVANGVFFANYKKQAWFTQSSDYFERVTLDLGAVRSQQAVKGIYKFLDSEGLYTDTKLLWFGDAGIKTRETTVSNTPLTFVSKGYSLDPTPNDLTQTTELNQPYLSGNIAPNERYALKNPSTATRVINHPQIAFTNAQRWTTTICARWDGTINTISALFGKNTTVSAIRIKNTTNVFAVTNESGTTVNGTVSTTKLIGKNIPMTFVGDLTSVKIYVEGVLFDTITISSEFNFVSLLRGLSAANTEFTGIVQFYRIQSGAMTAPQVAAEHAMLRSIYPEIESVQIGTQTWATSNLEMVATPMGNVIPNVTDNAAWANATTLYDNAIAGGATEANAVKAAAMWCYYDNDPNIGAVYGKLYNWYAAKLIQNDIDAYNVANPTAEWGWRVPTEADFNTLIATLGGDTVAGGKMKVTGTDYWSSPNTGADNSSGFSAIASGRRGNGGISYTVNFTGIKIQPRFWVSNSSALVYRSTPFILVSSGSLSFVESNVLTGTSIRLIKDE